MERAMAKRHVTARETTGPAASELRDPESNDTTNRLRRGD